MLPGRTSDAGPSSPACTCRRQQDPCPIHEGVQCACCGSEHNLDTVPCQGSDDCTERICSDCAEGRAKCDGCGLAACGDHLRLDPDTEKQCDICRADAAPRVPTPDGLDDNRPLEEMR